MKINNRVLSIAAFFGIALLAAAFDGRIAGAGENLSAAANVPDKELFAGLRWRNIGPFHGGRISAVTGALGESNVYYVGTPAGGVWKTTSAGVTWFPIFDQFLNVDSIGAVQVAPSDPNIVYVGTGDSVGGSNGDGMYKSTDAGQTWTHIGLEETVKINKITIDPKDPNIVVASTQGDAKHDGRGIYRTTDGGKTWENTLRPDNANGTRDLEYAFDTPNVMFATSQGAGGGFGGFGGPPPSGPNGTALYKSTDTGKTWTKITTLPPYTGRISVAVAMHTEGKRVYVIGNPPESPSGLYRSDDQGATWQHMAVGDARVGNGQGAFSSGVWVDSQNPDILYTVSTYVSKSTDGGKTFSVFKGAPGGEDPHDIWIDPTNGRRMLFGFDQGPAVTLDNGRTWSGYYQIPIAQLYKVATDTRYPYWVMGSQQDTGAVMTRSRGDLGQITNQDWWPLASSEFGTAVPDPLKPTTVYGVGYGLGQGNGMTKIDIETGQWGNVAPNFGADRDLYAEGRDFWKRFDTAFEPKAMYAGYNCILVTRDGAETWKPFSPDLTAPKGQPLAPCGVAPAPTTPAPNANGGRFTPRPTISDFSISTVKKGVVWSASSNGQIYNTLDGGKTWNNLTNFTDLPPNANFVTIEAGHNDVDTAYVVANINPARGGAIPEPEAHYVYRTHDGGKSWTRIVNGLPVDERTGSQVHVLREDPKQKGLLFAGTETTVFVSFDDGDNWQSLRQNLPSTSIRDMVFHTHDNMNDLVICTYGRGFWVLDDMSPLREIATGAQRIASAPAYLFKPGDAIRARENGNWDQPMNPELPHAQNPPFGALIYYHLGKKPQGEIRMEILDAAGNHVRTLTSVKPALPERPPYPDYWLMSPEDRALPTNLGTNRTNWNLRYDDPPGYNPDINNQMNAAPGQVTPGPHGPLALPGVYTVKLTVDGAVYTQTLVVHNDPRVGESPKIMAALKLQNKLALAAVQGMKDTFAANEEVTAVRAQLAALKGGSLPADVATALTALDTKLATIGGALARGGRGGFGGGFGAARQPGSLLTFSALNGTFNTVLGPLSQNGLDMPPTKAQIDTWESGCREYAATLGAWQTALGADLAGFNALLTKNNLTPLKLAPSAMTVPASCGFAGTPEKTGGRK
ncbi:MAG: hypothetical protein JSS81_22040 [Acidobacteria bacterium]|nr:hypothetical protein [Acidobacteriota bacterium]